MRRRLLNATLASVAVAVVLLGIPLSIFAAQSVRQDALADLDARTATLARALEIRYQASETLDAPVVETFLGTSSGAPMYISVTLPDGSEIVAGEMPNRSLSESHVTESGMVILTYTSWWSVFWKAARTVALLAGLAVLAVAAASLLAMRQARRLAEPLVFLAASAQQLGSGQVRLTPQHSGVEELDLVAEELARSADRMAQRLATERQFAADVSHQLRTPLTALSMRLEEIQLTSTEPEVQNEAQASLEQLERLVGVIDDLLYRTRRNQESTTKVVRVAEIFAQQEQEWHSSFTAAKRKMVARPTDLEVFATPGALAQVVATLLENSLKHGAGTTTVQAKQVPGGPMVAIEVRDEGPGVPAEIAPQIFARSVTSGRGTGLGLALARDLVAADGGRLELTQREPAVFTIFLTSVPRLGDMEKLVPHRSGFRRPRRRPIVETLDGPAPRPRTVGRTQNADNRRTE